MFIMQIYTKTRCWFRQEVLWVATAGSWGNTWQAKVHSPVLIDRYAYTPAWLLSEDHCLQLHPRGRAVHA